MLAEANATSGARPEPGERCAQNAAETRDENTFRHDLANQPESRRSQSHADFDFPVSRVHAREHQVGDVGAGDHEYEAHHTHEDQQGIRETVSQIGRALRAGMKHEPLLEEIRR